MACIKKYTEEQKIWIKNNAFRFNKAQDLVDSFNKTFDENRTKQAMSSLLRDMRVTLNRNYSYSQIQWLKSNYYNYDNYEELTKAYNKEYNCNKSVSGIQQQCIKCGCVKFVRNFFSPNMDDWLRKNVSNNCTWEEITLNFNNNFSTNIKEQRIADYCKRTLKIKKGASQELYNRKFKNGDVVKRNGYLQIKMPEKVGGSHNEYWIPLARYVYEKQFGKIPEECQIIFLDNNKNNCDIENLYCINRRYMPYMMHNKWFSTNPEETLAAIKWCEFIYAIQDN